MGSLRALVISLVLGALGSVIVLSILSTMTDGHGVSTIGNIPHSPRNLTLTSTTLCTTAPADIDKTVDPGCVDMGDTVSVCFTIRRPELDVVLAQDASGSMGDQVGEEIPHTARLTASKAAASAFVSYLQDTDRAAVVSFSTTAYLVQPLTTTRSKTLEAIDGLTAQGWTNIGEGISVSHSALVTPSCAVSNTVRAIVLMSDGRANCDQVDCSEDRTREAAAYAREMAEGAANAKIRIYTIGFGSDADEALLQDIASVSGGAYFSAPNGSVLEPIYLTIALELHNLVITDVLVPHVQADCSHWPDDTCIEGPGGVTTITFAISDNSLISNPLTTCFTASIGLDPGFRGPINGPGSSFCYRNRDGQAICDGFGNPWIAVKMCRLVYLPCVAKCYPLPHLGNGGFEDGWAGWIHGGVLSQTITSTNPHSGDFAALLGEPGDECEDARAGSAWIERGFCVCADDSPTLRFSYNIWTYDLNRKLIDKYDSLDVTINGQLQFRDAKITGAYGCDSSVNPDLGWRSAEISLDDYRGQQIVIRFEIRSTDGWFNTWAYIDDVEINQ